MSFLLYENFRSHNISAVFWIFLIIVYRSSYWKSSKVGSIMIRKQSIKNFDKVKETTQLSVKEHILHNWEYWERAGVRVRQFTKHRKFFFDVTNDTLHTLYISFTHFLAEFCSRFQLVLNKLPTFIYRMYLCIYLFLT